MMVKALAHIIILWAVAWATPAMCDQNLRIGYIDFADEWTHVEGVEQLLKSAGVDGTNLTPQLRQAPLELPQLDCIVAGSFFTNDKKLLSNFGDSRTALRSSVDRGGTIVIFSQADQDSKQEGWLPTSIAVARGDLDYSNPTVVQPDHQLFTTPNKLNDQDFADWQILEWHAAWETFEQAQNVAVLAAQDAQGASPCIVEAGWGKGRVLLFAMAPDKAYVIGNEKSKRVAHLLMQNILAYCQNVKDGKAAEVKVWKPKAASSYPYAITGTVFDDADGDSAKDEGETLLSGVAVTDGVDIVLTDDGGHYELTNPSHKAKLVYVLQPAGCVKTNCFYYFLVGIQEQRTFDFALRRLPRQQQDRFRFVQTTDIHVSGAEDLERFKKALGEVAQLVPRADFTIATGDLVNNGNYNHQLASYRKGVDSSQVTLFSVLGNHDCCNARDRAINFNTYLGPDYYSFDQGKCHFLVVNNVDFGTTQKQWIIRDIALLGKDKHTFVFLHYPHKEKDLEWFSAMGVRALFGGHWHTSKIHDFGALRCYAIPTFMMGAIDNSPAGFLVVDVDGGAITTHYRFGGIHNKLAIVYPSKDFAIAPEGINFILANIYDTTSLIAGAKFKIANAGKVVLEGNLEPQGEFTWRANVSKRNWDSGTYQIEIAATNERNETWTAAQDFDITARTHVPVRVKRAWTMFAGTPQRDPQPSATISPRFALSWAASTGASIDFSSPILADNTIYIGVRDRNALEHNGVMAIDARNGETKWFSKTQYAVNHSAAYAKGKVFATDVGGRVYALHAKTGHEVWHYDLGSSTTRWIFSAPAVDRNVVYAGSSAYFAALDCKNGHLVWRNQDGGDWITSYASPAVASDRVVMGGMWVEINGKSGSAYAMDKATGDLLWQADVLGLHGSPVVHKNTVFFNDSEGKFWALDLKTGATQWNYQMDPEWSAVTPAISEPLVITGSGAGTIYALDMRTHQPAWEFKTGNSDFLMSPYDKEHKTLVASPIIVGDIIYVGASNGTLYALDKRSGKQIWSHSFGVPILSTPLVSGNTFFVATFDGNIYALTSVPDHISRITQNR